MAIPIEVRVPTKITDGLSSGVLGYNKDTQQWSLQPAVGAVNTQFNSGSEGSGWGMYQANSGAFILGVGSKNMTMVSAAGTSWRVGG